MSGPNLPYADPELHDALVPPTGDQLTDEGPEVEAWLAHRDQVNAALLCFPVHDDGIPR